LLFRLKEAFLGSELAGGELQAADQIAKSRERVLIAVSFKEVERTRCLIDCRASPMIILDHASDDVTWTDG
jgi:hypothetical protein